MKSKIRVIGLILGLALGALVSTEAQSFTAPVPPVPLGGLLGDPKQVGRISITDWVKVGRVSVGLDGRQFIPLSDIDGDGAVTIRDWILEGRGAANLDEKVGGTAGGPDLRLVSPAAKPVARDIPLVVNNPYLVTWIRKADLQTNTVFATLASHDGKVAYRQQVPFNNTGTFYLTPPADIVRGTYTLTLAGTNKDGSTPFDSVNIEVIDQFTTSTAMMLSSQVTSLVAGTNQAAAVYQGDLDRDGLTLYGVGLFARIKRANGDIVPGADYITGFRILDFSGAVLVTSKLWNPNNSTDPVLPGALSKSFVPVSELIFDGQTIIQVFLNVPLSEVGGTFNLSLNEIDILPEDGQLLEIESLSFSNTLASLPIVAPVQQAPANVSKKRLQTK